MSLHYYSLTIYDVFILIIIYYIHNNYTCQRNKDDMVKIPGELQPLLIPKIISMISP
jgi:hypothetical protein